ncbi:hypothetical protein Ocin01_15264 [Orchesella cincta]|uniref:Calcium signal-modulating cyclophilin ligand n=1 Tax=Orchesella cincta TaxID=48709 RepID=A0A1D2MEJ1_ORCCI|nr:hypothetical protein Ocin01_15264 [Orchesella cincta]
MADEDSGGAGGTMSEAEKRRLRRRQKILENQGARLQKIVGSDSGISSSLYSEQDTSLRGINRQTIGDDDNDPPIEIFKKAADYGVGSNSNFPGTSGAPRASSSSSSSSTLHSHPSGAGRSDPPNLSSLLQELSGELGSEPPRPTTTERQREPRMGVQADGTVLLPKVSTVSGRLLICCLAFFLSLFSAKHFLVTFMSWEFAFYWLNGLPAAPPPNMIMVLVTLMGLKEQQLKKLKTFTHLVDCMSIDFSLFLTGVMLPHIISNVVKAVG